ncbi:HpcH/HpaI aldolase/citrate lyase family protein [Deinococcus cellulosilyticus]|uniref:ATP-binding protein n=1 Tax=Deinococcus cellulosilyticus (strain DSM 18568 / NBRC 106333 / KACC 11606 / 5516J-15) TaxID=1223518 RepID=A0A511MUX7_DEIC1|nr:HpcH/HpaI aldolase/citrate lyase family protein [Deinococcus cellulosilyticus]GEM44403.1 ATP-binding protein [Deinococcus cellulosilyticus NBRC 106333 = KACC 11606]
MQALELGASLYVPGTHAQLQAIVNGEKYPFLRSVILCTEDAVLPQHLPEALHNISQALKGMRESHLKVFIRPRNIPVLQTLLDMEGIEQVQGFVLPKVEPQNLPLWMGTLKGTSFHIMPTLETRIVFDRGALDELRSMLLAQQHRVLSLRIGGNDLLSLLNMRRSRGVSAYQTPLGALINQLVLQFKPYGFNLSAPVYDFTDDPETLIQETRMDLQSGLFGKTAIHPSQVPVIESLYRVSGVDLEMAQAILAPDAPAVFKLGDAMCEPATHSNWAHQMMDRFQVYGVDLGAPIPLLAVNNG